MNVTRGSLLGKYRLISLLGAGGMAEVWKAKIEGPAGFERMVVVKRVLPHLARDASFVKMFLDEARLSALLDHPNIVQVHELGEAGGEYFMAMEYLRGCDLNHLLRRGVALPVGCSVAIVQAICRALGYAHALCDDAGKPLRLVHRDVSPSNVMLVQAGGVKLLDFGVAKALGGSAEQRTETGTLKGKCGYMSPEQVDGKQVDPRSDLFAAGVVLHELLTSRRLFKGASDFITLSLVRAADVPPPSTINPSIPPELDAVCLRALARDPEARYASGEEMAAALEPFLDGGSVAQLSKLVASTMAAQAEAQLAIDPTLTEDGGTVNTSPSAVGSRDGRVRKGRRARSLVVATSASAGLLLLSLALLVTKLHRAAPRIEPRVALPMPSAEPVAATAPPAAIAPAPPAPSLPTVPEPAKPEPHRRRRVSRTRANAAREDTPRATEPHQRDFDPESALPQ